MIYNLGWQSLSVKSPAHLKKSQFSRSSVGAREIFIFAVLVSSTRVGKTPCELVKFFYSVHKPPFLCFPSGRAHWGHSHLGQIRNLQLGAAEYLDDSTIVPLLKNHLFDSPVSGRHTRDIYIPAVFVTYNSGR